MIEVDTIYTGKDGTKRIVTSVADGVVTFMFLRSGGASSCAVADFEAWRA